LSGFLDVKLRPDIGGRNVSREQKQNALSTTNSMIHQAKVTEMPEGPLQMPTKWVRPVFEAVDGMADLDGLHIMDGLVLAFGFIDDSGANSYGSGVMVAPGLLVTATHVAEATRNTAGMAYSFLANGQMRLWAPHQVHLLTGPANDVLSPGDGRRRVSDVTLASCFPMSDIALDQPLAHGTS
jgi:hypothetical protein